MIAKLLTNWTYKGVTLLSGANISASKIFIKHLLDGNVAVAIPKKEKGQELLVVVEGK